MAISFNPDKLLYCPIFSKKQLAYLEALHHVSKSEFLLVKRNIEAFSIDFAYTSAVLEGNTYTSIEAEILLKTGRTAANERKMSEAVMLENMRDSFDYAVYEATHKTGISFQALVKNLHSIASDRLLDKKYCGAVRTMPVTIGSCSYVPSSIPQQLEAGLDLIANEYQKIRNPFEKSVYVHLNLSYLQYFLDHNKRTARNMSAYALLSAGKMPVMFTENTANEYAKAVLSYYESESPDYRRFADYFISAYEKVCSRLNPDAIVEARNIVAKAEKDKGR